MVASIVPAAALTYLTSALALAPAIIRLGLELKPLAEQIYNTINKDGGPSDDDLAALAAKRAEIRKKLEDLGHTDIPIL